MTAKQESAVVMALVRLMMLARHSLSPTQTSIATEFAGELLWFMGIPEYTYEGRTFFAVEPQGEVVDLQPTRQLT